MALRFPKPNAHRYTCSMTRTEPLLSPSVKAVLLALTPAIVWLLGTLVAWGLTLQWFDGRRHVAIVTITATAVSALVLAVGGLVYAIATAARAGNRRELVIAVVAAIMGIHSVAIGSVITWFTWVAYIPRW